MITRGHEKTPTPCKRRGSWFGWAGKPSEPKRASYQKELYTMIADVSMTEKSRIRPFCRTNRLTGIAGHRSMIRVHSDTEPRQNAGMGKWRQRAADRRCLARTYFEGVCNQQNPALSSLKTGWAMKMADLFESP